MKVVNANAEYLTPVETNPYGFIEKIGRTCYKSEDKMTENSAISFVQMLAEKKHAAMLEHYHVYVKADSELLRGIADMLDRAAETIGLADNEISRIRNFVNITIDGDRFNLCGYISCSLRTLIDISYAKRLRQSMYVNAFLDFIVNKIGNVLFPDWTRPSPTYRPARLQLLTRDEFVADVKKYSASAVTVIKNHLTHTVFFTCDRGVSHELVRHRVASYAMESTRYCNYQKGKFGNEITIIQPCFWTEGSPEYECWYNACATANDAYMALINMGATAQQARDILPHSVKTDIAITAVEDEWQHILNQRLHGTTGTPHPQMAEIMQIAYPALTVNSENRLV